MFPRIRGLGEAPVTPVPAPSFYEEPAIFVYDKTLTGSAEYTAQAVFVDGDSDFVLQALAGSATSSSYQVKFRLPNGRALMSSYVNSANIIGTAQFPVALPREIVIPASGSLGIDIKDTSGSSNTVQLILIGLKRFRTA